MMPPTDLIEFVMDAHEMKDGSMPMCLIINTDKLNMTPDQVMEFIKIGLTKYAKLNERISYWNYRSNHPINVLGNSDQMAVLSILLELTKIRDGLC